MRLQIQRWLMAFHIGKTFFAWEQVNMTMRILREKQCSVGGRAGCLSRAYQKRELVLKSDFSQPYGLQFGLKTLRGGASWSGSLLGGVSWNKGAIVKENMFYFGGIRENLSSSTIKLLTWSCWYWEEAEKNSRPSNSMTEPSRNYVCDTVIVVDTII